MSSFNTRPHSSKKQDRQSNGSCPSYQTRPQVVLDATPLNFVPYSGPHPPYTSPHSPIDIYDSPSSPKDSSLPIGDHPAVVFVPPNTTKGEWNNIIAATKSAIALTGSAALGKVGQVIGAVDIFESADNYMFRVALPGASRDEKHFSCNAEPSGKIIIRGVSSTGQQRVSYSNMIFVMKTRNLCPPNEFSISFCLPGPIDRNRFTAIFGPDGIFEGVVKKKQQ